MHLDKISIDDLKRFLHERELLPSRSILKQNIDHNFKEIERTGVENTAQLLDTIRSKKKLNEFTERAMISDDYLTILKREIGSLIPKVVLLKNFPEIDTDLIESLQQLDISDSIVFYETYLSQERDTGLEELFCLCDLVRVNGIGAVAARVFYEAGFRSVSDIAKAEPNEMLCKITQINDVRQYYKVALRIKDMQFCIDYAKMILRYS